MPFDFRKFITSSLQTAPPPVEITTDCFFSASFSVCNSIFLKNASPFCSKISLTDMPCDDSITESRSTKGYLSCAERHLPIVVLPTPINPTKIIRMFVKFAFQR